MPNLSLRSVGLAGLALGSSLMGYCQACTKEEYREKFGALPTYELLPSPEPKLDGDHVVAYVRYITTCKNGGSNFEAIAKEMPPGMDTFDVTLLRRDEPDCESHLPVTTTWEGKVRVPLPEFKKTSFKQKPLMLAFPPDGHYEIYMLRSAYAKPENVDPQQAPTAFDESRRDLTSGSLENSAENVLGVEDEYANMTPEQKTAKVQKELASQDAQDSINHLEHCLSTSEGERSSCCCDEMIEGLKKKVAEDAAMLIAGSDNATEEDTVGARVEIDAGGSLVDSLVGGAK